MSPAKAGSDLFRVDLFSKVEGCKRKGRAAHSEARRREKESKEIGLGQDRRVVGGATEEVTWDSLVVPRLPKYYGTAVK